MSELSRASVVIRDYQPSDYAVVLKMWQEGFHEMSKHSYSSIISSPWTFGVPAVAAMAAYAFGSPTAAACIAGSAALLYTPAGRAAFSWIFWQAIYGQTRASMQPHHLDARDSARCVWLVPGRAHFFVAEDSSTHAPLGCVAVKAVHTLHGERVKGVGVVAGEASIWRLSVAPSARRLGVGAALVRAAEGWAKAQRCSHISLITGNPESQAFYRRIGYGTEDERRARAVLLGAAHADPGSRAAGAGAGGGAGARASLSIMGWLKARGLQHRLHSRGSVMMKQLV